MFGVFAVRFTYANVFGTSQTRETVNATLATGSSLVVGLQGLSQDFEKVSFYVDF